MILNIFAAVLVGLIGLLAVVAIILLALTKKMQFENEMMLREAALQGMRMAVEKDQ